MHGWMERAWEEGSRIWSPAEDSLALAMHAQAWSEHEFRATTSCAVVVQALVILYRIDQLVVLSSLYADQAAATRSSSDGTGGTE